MPELESKRYSVLWCIEYRSVNKILVLVLRSIQIVGDSASIRQREQFSNNMMTSDLKDDRALISCSLIPTCCVHLPQQPRSIPEKAGPLM